MNDRIDEQLFFSVTDGTRSFADVVHAIVAAYRSRPHENFRVSVGTDSEELEGGVKFVTAIVLWHVGHGARAWRCNIWNNAFKTKEKGFHPKRIYEEIILTATLTVELRSRLREALGEEVLRNLEVHADIGEGGRTSVLMREIIGMLLGYGFPLQSIKWKPEAIAASVVADRYI